MSRNCYGCGTGFGVFKKEHSCKNCGFAFCSTCLSKKAEVPKLNNETHKVCTSCFKKLTGKVKPPDRARYSPPEALRKLQDQNMQQQQPSHKQPGPSRANQAKYRGMAKEDIAIAQRLEKLKEAKQPAKPVQNTDEMAERLAKLRGMDPSKVTSQQNRFVAQTDTRTQHQQVEDLMDELFSEVEIDNKLPKPDEQIASRLASLKGQGNTDGTDAEGQNNLNKDTPNPKAYMQKNIMPHGNTDNTNSEEVTAEEMNRMIAEVARELEIDANKAVQGLKQDKELQARLAEIKADKATEKKSNTDEDEAKESDEENEEEATKKLIKRILEENRLDAAASAAGHADLGGATGQTDLAPPNFNMAELKEIASQAEDPDELPWCCICNTDADVRCHGCDSDLYCNRCFREGHDKEDIKDHKTSRYKGPPMRR